MLVQSTYEMAKILEVGWTISKSEVVAYLILRISWHQLNLGRP